MNFYQSIVDINVVYFDYKFWNGDYYKIKKASQRVFYEAFYEFVDPEGFEPSSKHGTRCAFYMHILWLVLVNNLATNSRIDPQFLQFSKQVQNFLALIPTFLCFQIGCRQTWLPGNISLTLLKCNKGHLNSVKIKQQERSYFRLLSFENQDYSAAFSMRCMLTHLSSILSIPVEPIIFDGFFQSQALKSNKT